MKIRAGSNPALVKGKQKRGFTGKASIKKIKKPARCAGIAARYAAKGLVAQLVEHTVVTRLTGVRFLANPSPFQGVYYSV